MPNKDKDLPWLVARKKKKKKYSLHGLLTLGTAQCTDFYAFVRGSTIWGDVLHGWMVSTITCN